MLDDDTPENMNAVLDRVVAHAEGERVSVGEILQILGTRSYGPALVLISVISMLPPISVTPGLPMLTGTLTLVLSAQLLFMRRTPWLPKRILQWSFTREKLEQAVNRARPWAARFGRLVGPRLHVLLLPPFVNLIALVCVLLALLTFLLSPLPAGENIPTAAVLIFGLALTARDGLLALIGLAVTGTAFGLLIYFWPTIWEAILFVGQAVGL